MLFIKVIVIKHFSRLQRLGLFNIAFIQLGFSRMDSFSYQGKCPGLNTGIDPTTTTTIRRFIDSIRAEKFHLSLESM